MKALLKKLGLRVLGRLCGVRVVDQRTGQVIGRVIVVRWRGGLRIMGFEGVAVRPHFLPQASERYWAQDLVFSTWPPPDYPYVENSHCSDLAPDAAGSSRDVRDMAARKS